MLRCFNTRKERCVIIKLKFHKLFSFIYFVFEYVICVLIINSVFYVAALRLKGYHTINNKVIPCGSSLCFVLTIG